MEKTHDVVLDDQRVAIHSAITWCDTEQVDYELTCHWPSSRWQFRFSEATMATEFALRWCR